MAKKDIAILDIGSSAITTLVGERGVNNTFRIKGKGSADYAGFSDGSFIEPEQLKKLVDKVSQIEDQELRERTYAIGQAMLEKK